MKKEKICNCDRQKIFNEYKLSKVQGKKILPLSNGKFYLHLPINPNIYQPHIFCSDGTKKDITIAEAFNLKIS